MCKRTKNSIKFLKCIVKLRLYIFLTNQANFIKFFEKKIAKILNSAEEIIICYEKVRSRSIFKIGMLQTSKSLLFCSWKAFIIR